MVADRSSQQAGALGGVDEADFWSAYEGRRHTWHSLLTNRGASPPAIRFVAAAYRRLQQKSSWIIRA